MTNSYRTIRRGAIAVSLLAISATATPALAENQDFSFRFAYDEAALQTDAEARQVYLQLVADAHDACRMRAPSAQRHVDTNCRALLVDSVIGRIGNPRLDRIQDREQGAASPIQTAAR